MAGMAGMVGTAGPIRAHSRRPEIQCRRVSTRPGSSDVPVVASAAAAARLLRSGRNVVLLVDPDAGHVVCPAEGPGRLAIFAGELDDPATWAAAEAMAGEVFGSG